MLDFSSCRPGDHLCAVLPGPTEVATVAGDFLRGAASANQAALFVPAERVTARYGQIVTSRQVEQVADAFLALLDDAMDAGFDGLRVATDVTPMLVGVEAQEGYLRYEAVVDRVMRSSGRLTGLCLATAPDLDADAVEDLCALHAWSDPAAGVRCWWDAERGVRCLAGDLDLSNVALVERTVGRLLADAGHRRFDIAGCEYVDHHAVRAINRAARGADMMVELLGASSLVRRVVAIVAPDRVVIAD